MTTEHVETTSGMHEPVLVKWAGETSLRCSCENWRGRNPVDLEGHEAHRRAVDHSTWTLRDLLRLAHQRGLHLSKSTASNGTRERYQVWQENQHPDPSRPWEQGYRWVEVNYWPGDDTSPTWKVRINGRESEGSHMLHAEMWDPSITEIVGALGWLGLLAARPTDTRTTTQEASDAE